MLSEWLREFFSDVTWDWLFWDVLTTAGAMFCVFFVLDFFMF